MSLIIDTVRSIVALVLLAALLELLLPEGALLRTTRWVIGIMMVALLFSSLSGVDFVLPDWSDMEQQEAAAAYQDTGAEISAQVESRAAEDYYQELERQVALVVSSVAGVRDVSVDVFADEQGALQYLQLQVSADEDVSASLKQLICGLYQLEEENIMLIMEVAEDD